MNRFFHYVLFPAGVVTMTALVVSYFAALAVYKASARIEKVQAGRRDFNRFLTDQLLSRN